MFLTLVAAISLKSSVTVFAAASLKDAFTAISAKFESANPGISVKFSFAGSQTLAAQIAHGAPADVFASAALKNLNDAKPDRKTIRTIARNRLVLIFRKGSSASTPKDLVKTERLVIADDRVPAGAYAVQFLGRAEREYGPDWFKQVIDKISSREVDVRAVLAKVKLGEADAGIVYYSDWFISRNRTTSVGIPQRMNVFASYPMALTSHPVNRAGGRAFMDFVLSKEGQYILKSHGFLEAPAKR